MKGIVGESKKKTLGSRANPKHKARKFKCSRCTKNPRKIPNKNIGTGVGLNTFRDCFRRQASWGVLKRGLAMAQEMINDK